MLPLLSRRRRCATYCAVAPYAVPQVYGEALRRYVMFLLHARGDISGVEDMFMSLIDEKPESSNHRSRCVWFLWMTGGIETCLMDTSKNNINNVE